MEENEKPETKCSCVDKEPLSSDDQAGIRIVRSVVIGVVLCIACVSGCIAHNNKLENERELVKFKEGYVQVQAPLATTYSYIWVKTNRTATAEKY
jgi:hypothetical protein